MRATASSNWIAEVHVHARLRAETSPSLSVLLQRRPSPSWWRLGKFLAPRFRPSCKAAPTPLDSIPAFAGIDTADALDTCRGAANFAARLSLKLQCHPVHGASAFRNLENRFLTVKMMAANAKTPVLDNLYNVK